MTLEERARAIADKRGRRPGSAQHVELEAFALRMLREAVDKAFQDERESHDYSLGDQ